METWSIAAVTLLAQQTTADSTATGRWSAVDHVETGGKGGDHGACAVLPRRRSPIQTQPKPETVALLRSLARMTDGDHAALAICYDLMGGVVFSLAVRMMRDRQAAEDVTQDIFVQVWRRAASFDARRGSPTAWIMMIARTRILDRLRSRRAGVVLKPMGENLPDAPAAEDWPIDLAISQEDAATVRQALASLPPDQKQAVELAFFEGLTHADIAVRLNVPLGTIKTRIRLGLMKIKDRIGDLIEAPLPSVSNAATARAISEEQV